MRIRLLPPVLLAGAMLVAACSSDSAGPSTRNQVTFSVTTTGTIGAALLSDTSVSGTDTLVLSQVELVLRDIRFKRTGDDVCNEHGDEDDDSLETASIRHDDGDDSDDDGHDSCESFNAGPYLLDLPLGPGVKRAFTVVVDTGSYNEVRFKLHKPQDNNGNTKDAAFLAAHPGFNGVSIRATGSFNGTPFTFESALTAQQRKSLVPPIVVSDSTLNVDVTIKVDVASWFRNGAALIDPSSANKGGDNEHAVRDNIRNSFGAFCDNNHDGHDDHDDHHGGDDD